jgi:LysM repeat protein
MLGSLGCSLGSLITGARGPSPTPTKTLIPTFTATATHTATSTPTETSTPTDTPIPVPTDTPTPIASPTPQYSIYVVQAGDTLGHIASRFGTTVQAIKDLNGLTSDLINIGTELLIPTGESPVSTATPTRTSAAPAPTPTPRPQAPTATPTRRPPTATAAPSFAYKYRENSMRTLETGCGHVRIEGWVYRRGGAPADGVTVELAWSEGTEYFKTGDPMEEHGFWKFTPLPYGPALHGDVTFRLRMVRSESDPVPLSNDFNLQYRNCSVGPELFLDVTFDEL